MNILTKLAIFVLFSLFITGCGDSSLNAKNADTFQTTFKNMIKDLSEGDRRKVGTGLLLMATHDSPGAIKLSEISSSKRDAEYLIASNQESPKNTQLSKIIGDLIIQSNGRLDGKNRQDFINFLAKSIDSATKTEKEANEKLKLEAISQSESEFSKLEQEKEKINKSIVNLEKLKEELKEKSNKLRAEGKNYIKSVDFSKLKYNKTNHTVIGSVSVTVKNLFDKNIMPPEVGMDVSVKSDPLVKGTQGYATFDIKKIKPNEQRTFTFNNIFIPIRSDNVKFNFPMSIDAYTIKPYIRSTKLEDGSKKSFILQGKEWRFLKENGYKQAITKCNTQLEKLEEFKVKMIQNIEALKLGKLKTYQIPKRYRKFECSGKLSNSPW